MTAPQLQPLLADVRSRKADCVVLNKVDRLMRITDRLRQNRRYHRRVFYIVCLSDTEIQHDDVQGAADAQCTSVLHII